MALSSLTNLAISTVATAPSPSTSGTSLTVASGHGSRFPSSGSFPVVIWPTATNPDPSNAEIALCTSRSGDVLTITRAQESTTARTVVVGDQVMLSVTKAVLDGMAADVQVFNSSGTWTKPAGAKWVHVKAYGGGAGGGSGRRGAAATDRYGGGGGGGAGWVEALLSASAIDASVSVTVGAGGAGGAAVAVDSTNGNAGSAGGQSMFPYNSSNSAMTLVSAQFNPLGGGGGSTTAGSGGGSTSGSALWDGSPGRPGVTNGAASSTTNNYGCGGGGGGGGISSGDAVGSGVNSLAAAALYGGNAFTGGSAGTSGGSGVTLTSVTGLPGRGGGGGAASLTAAGGSGAVGSVPGGGGGGGAGSLNGFNSGAGGAGGAGQVIVTTYF